MIETTFALPTFLSSKAPLATILTISPVISPALTAPVVLMTAEMVPS